jgi:hypothetical protein
VVLLHELPNLGVRGHVMSSAIVLSTTAGSG